MALVVGALVVLALALVGAARPAAAATRIARMFLDERAASASPTHAAAATFATLATQQAKAYLTYESLPASYASQWRSVSTALLLARLLNATLVLPMVFPFPREVAPGNGLPLSMAHVPGDLPPDVLLKLGEVETGFSPPPPAAPFILPPSTVTTERRRGKSRDDVKFVEVEPWVEGDAKHLPGHVRHSKVNTAKPMHDYGRRRRRRRVLLSSSSSPSSSSDALAHVQPSEELKTWHQLKADKEEEKNQKKQKKQEKKQEKKREKEEKKAAKRAMREPTYEAGEYNPPVEQEPVPTYEHRTPHFLPPWRDAGTRLFEQPPLALPFGYLFDAAKFVEAAKTLLGVEVIASLPRDVGYPQKGEATVSVSFEECKRDPAVVRQRRMVGPEDRDPFCLGPTRKHNSKFISKTHPEQILSELDVAKKLAAATERAENQNNRVTRIHYAFPPLLTALPVHKHERCKAILGCTDAIAAVHPNRIIAHAAERAVSHLSINYTNFDAVHWSQEIPDAAALAEHDAQWRLKELECETPLEHVRTISRAETAVQHLLKNKDFRDNNMFSDEKAGLFVSTTVNDPEALSRFKANFPNAFSLEDLVPMASMRFPPAAVEALSFEVAVAAGRMAYAAGSKSRDGPASAFSNFASLLFLVRRQAGRGTAVVDDDGHC